MRKILLLIAAVFLFAPLAAAQKTTVTATIVDPNGIPYANSTVSIALQPPGVTSPTVGNIPVNGFVSTGTDANGSFSIDLFCNTAGGACTTAISPSGTKWQFTVCNPGVPAPLGFGNQCFTPAAITITGTTQDVSTQMNAAAPSLTRTGTPIRKATVTLTAAQVKSLIATPATILSAAPAGQMWLPKQFMIRYDAGAAAYTNNVAGQLIFYYTNLASPSATHNVSAMFTDDPLNLGSTTSQVTFVAVFSLGLTNTLSSILGSGISMTFVPGTSGELATGDGTLTVTMYYVLVN